MSNQHLPAELLDHIVDLLYDARNALKICCLVSKSWIPRTRKHIFTDVGFCTPSSLRSLRKSTFPHPSTSPARYTRLHQNPTHSVPSRRYGRGCGRRWPDSDLLSCLCNSRLIPKGYHTVTSSLVFFHGFSLATKSLLLTFPALSLPRAWLTSSFYSLFSKTSL